MIHVDTTDDADLDWFLEGIPGAVWNGFGYTVHPRFRRSVERALFEIEMEKQKRRKILACGETIN